MDPTQIAPHAFDITPYIQLGSFGVLVALIWHMIKVQIPAQERRADERDAKFMQEISRSRAECAEERAAMMKAHAESLAVARENFAQEMSFQREHDEIERSKTREAIAQRNLEDERRERNHRERTRGSAGGEGA